MNFVCDECGRRPDNNILYAVIYSEDQSGKCGDCYRCQWEKWHNKDKSEEPKTDAE